MKRKVISVLKWIGIVLLVAIAGLYIFVLANQRRTFEAPYPEIGASADSAVIARGKQLVYGPAHCANCHTSPEDEERVKNGEFAPLIGGQKFDLPIGTIYTRNLTPDESGIGGLTDPEIARTLRYGVASDGRALFDFMPFHNTSDEDLTAIISYLRSERAIENIVPENTYNIIGKIVKALVLEPAGPSEEVPVSVKRDTSAIYGKYLANSVANCRGCHTNRDLMTGAYLGEDYSGGLVFETETDSGTYRITTPNLTPDKTGRLTGWTQEQFIARFRMGSLVPQSHMPWGPFSKMSDDELKAIYNFLHSIKPVHNEITQTVVLETIK